MNLVAECCGVPVPKLLWEEPGEDDSELHLVRDTGGFGGLDVLARHGQVSLAFLERRLCGEGEC